jgi:DNA repair exonuclease SbcCD ATPase subunit
MLHHVFSELRKNSLEQIDELDTHIRSLESKRKEISENIAMIEQTRSECLDRQLQLERAIASLEANIDSLVDVVYEIQKFKGFYLEAPNFEIPLKKLVYAALTWADTKEEFFAVLSPCDEES